MKLEFNKQARNDLEAIGAGGAIKKDKRVLLKLPDLGKLEARATSPLFDKFTLLTLGEKEDQLANAYSVTMRLVEMTKHFKRFDLQDVFYIVKTTVDATDGSLQPVTSPAPLYLLDDYAKVSIKEVQDSIRFFRIYGKDYHIQNLEWSELFLEQSCEDELKKKVLENMMNVPDLERGGPLFFKIMMNIITSNTEEAIRTLTSKLSTFKITSIQGENINKAVSQLRGAYRRLLISEKVPHDISDRLINVFRNTSVEEFNSTFKTMKDNIRIENRKYEPEDILRIAELTYTEMMENGLWNAPLTTQESSFVVTTTCWNCGGKGHKADECPSKKVTNQVIHPTQNRIRGKWSAPRNGEPHMKTINGKLFKYNPNSKRWDKQSDEAGLSSAAGVSNAVTKVASDSKPSETSEPAACVASFSTIVQTGAQDAFNRFSH